MEETLKQIMGESFKENMTSDEIQNFFKNQVLGTGLYVNKEAADAEKRKLQNDLDAKKNELQNRMTDDEKKIAADQALREELENLKQQLLQGKINANEYKAIGITAKARMNSGIEENDKDFSEFINSIATDNEEKTSKIANYINTLVEKAYEKGKTDATKTQLGKMGGLKTNNDGSNLNQSEQRAKELAEKVNGSQVKAHYFK